MKLLLSRVKAVALIALVSLTGIGSVAQAEPVPPGSADEIRARLQPAGALCRVDEDCGVAAAAVASGPLSGKQVYDQFCFACHATGVGDAPLLSDTAAWQEREAKGMDALWDSMVNGIGAMPPKGTCMSCSDDDLRGALDFMLAGGEE